MDKKEEKRRVFKGALVLEVNRTGYTYHYVLVQIICVQRTSIYSCKLFGAVCYTYLLTLGTTFFS